MVNLANFCPSDEGNICEVYGLKFKSLFLIPKNIKFDLRKKSDCYHVCFRDSHKVRKHLEEIRGW